MDGSSVLNSRIHISIKMSTLLSTLFAALLITAFILRYRAGSKYSRLSRNTDNDEKESEEIVTDIWNVPNDSDSDFSLNDKHGRSHFDEFLKAIKVFGFLEHDVFNELTRSTQTLRFQRDEKVVLSDLDGFTVVINGAMKVYSKSSDKTDDEYDLLNEVHSPAPISSLSSILSLFSEDIVSGESEEACEFDKVNASVFAIASEPSTVVVIPSEAFRKLTRKFPRATANIVQIILFRWSQVTFRTCQKYLNLTLQFYGTERLLNESASARVALYQQQLPRLLVNDVIQQLQALRAENPNENIITLERKQPNWYRSNNDIPISSTETDGLSSNINKSVSVDLLNDISRKSSEFPGTLLSHAPLNYNSRANEANFMSGSSIASNSSSRRPSTISSQLNQSHTRSSSIVASNISTLNSTGSQFSDTSNAHNNMFANFSCSNSFLNSPSTEGKGYRTLGLNEDTEQRALRRAIVEKMFSIIMVEPGTFANAASFGSDFDSEEHDDGSDEHSVYCMYAFDEENDSNRKPRSKEGHDRYSLSDNEDVNPYSNDNTISGHAKCKSAEPEYPPESKKGPKQPVFRNNFSNSYGDIIEDASGMVDLMWYAKGEYLNKAGERSCGLVYVLDGCLEVVSDQDQSAPETLYYVNNGNIAGFLETISSYTSFVDLKAKTDSCVAIISRDYFDKLAERYPLLTISIAKALTRNLTRPLVQLDFALEWISIKSGGKLLSEGTKPAAVYFVLNGRLRAYKERKQIGDFGHGSTVGELEMMSDEKSSATVVAVRDTELSRFPRTLVECLCRQYPSITFEMARMVQQAMAARNSQRMNSDSGRMDFKTVAILPTSQELPVEEFAIKLSTAFENIGKEVKVLTNSVILRFLGKYTFQKMGILKLKAYLADLEDQFDILLYVADDSSSMQWYKTCIDQADCVLLLADGTATPRFSDIERMVVRSPTRSRAHLILLHRNSTVPRGSTAKWLKNRPWISAHHHIYMPFLQDAVAPEVLPRGKNKVRKTFNSIKNIVQDEIKSFQQKRTFTDYNRVNDATTGRLEFKSDFNRLARLLAGEAVGLVLGGGGARGISHVGVIRALEEKGIPIDLIGGTSIGSFIGGIYAKDYDLVQLLGRSKKFSARVSSYWRLLLDLTYPVTAWTTGHAFNQAIWQAFGDSRIEDFWIKYFTNTTNLTHSRMEIHQSGYSWRFIRASMSLAGLLPPIEDRGNLLLDGGYVDNLPVNEMKRLGAKYIIAVDVGAVDDTRPYRYGDTISGLYALINRYNPFSKSPNAPNIAEIQQRLTYVSSVKALEEAKTEKNVIYLRPPIDNYGTLDFKKFDEIVNVGFAYGMEALATFESSGKLPKTNRRYKEGRMLSKIRRHSM